VAEETFARNPDEYGPEKVVCVHEPRSGLETIVVIDHGAAGPAIGGIRDEIDCSVDVVEARGG
jgi:hypothetical protein